MAKQSRAQAQAARRREDAAFKFLAAGVVFVIVPLLFRAAPLGKALWPIIPLGLLVLAVGGALLLIPARQRKPGGAPAVSHSEYVPTLLTRLDVSDANLVPAEFDRSGAQGKVARGR